MTDSTVLAELFETSSFSASGTLVPSYNMNRNSANVADMKVSHAISDYTVGVIIAAAQVYGSVGPGQMRLGGNARPNAEIILKPNEIYILRLTPSGASKITMIIDWYEV